MAINVDTELSEFIVNDVATDELAQELADSGAFKEGQIIITPDTGSGGGSGGGSSGGSSTIIWEVWE